MKARSVTLAIAVLALWLVPSASLAQGNSGKTRLTICHIPPGNPDARRTMTVPEPAWGAHESHGDTLGPCDGYSERYDDGYGAEPKRAKKAKKKKGKKEYRSGSDRGDADDEIEADDRADEREEIDEADSESAAEEVDENDERGRRERRRAERHERRSRDRSQAPTDAGQTEEGAAPDDAGDEEVGDEETGDAGSGTVDAREAEDDTAREPRAGGRGKRGAKLDAQTDDPGEEERGFFRGMRQFFGFGEDESADESEE
jgi:hypothetical protein